MENIISWNTQPNENSNDLEVRIKDHLREKTIALREIEAERTKSTKKLKGPKLEEWLQENPFDPEEYKRVDQKLIDEIFSTRLSHPDCNAGAVFTNLRSPVI